MNEVGRIKRNPSKGTQQATILEHLQSGRTIDQIQSNGIYAVNQLASCVFHLKQLGWDIRKTSRRGVKGTYSEYQLFKGE